MQAATLVRRRGGFTLVELLTVIAIIGVLVALLLTGIQSARETARRTQCQTNIKEIGLACQNYHSANNHFPVGEHNCSNAYRFYDWMVHLLPFIEQEPLYSRIVFQFYPSRPWLIAGYAVRDQSYASVPLYNVPNIQNNVIQNTHISMFACPSNSDMPMLVHCCSALPWPGLGAADRAGVTYSAVATHVWNADQSAAPNASGVIFCTSKTPLGDIVDGASNTLMIAEVYENYDDVKKERYWYQNARGDGLTVTGEQYCPRGKCNLGPGWTYGNQTTTFHGINRRVKFDAANSAWISLGNFGTINSFHRGGAVFGMADGSTKFIADTIPTNVLQTLGTRKPGMFPGEVIHSDEHF